MCGIVGYIGKREAETVMLDGLKRLEYRGYDSSGLAIHRANTLDQTKRVGRVANLESAVHQIGQPEGSLGISHTRWATHGAVTQSNAHPHASSDGRVALVHNGVLDNYLSLKEFLLTKGYKFASDTDSEVLCNLIAYNYSQLDSESYGEKFLAAVRKSLTLVEGTYGIAALCIDCPDLLIGARKGSPLIIGVGRSEHLIASDVNAITHRTQNVVYLNDNEIVSINRDDFSISTLKSKDVTAVVEQVFRHLVQPKKANTPFILCLKKSLSKATHCKMACEVVFQMTRAPRFLGAESYGARTPAS